MKACMKMHGFYGFTKFPAASNAFIYGVNAVKIATCERYSVTD